MKLNRSQRALSFSMSIVLALAVALVPKASLAVGQGDSATTAATTAAQAATKSSSGTAETTAATVSATTSATTDKSATSSAATTTATTSVATTSATAATSGKATAVSLSAQATFDSLASAASTALDGSVFTVSSSLNTSLTLDIASGSKVAGGIVQLWSKNDTPAQRYRLSLNEDGFYTITNVGSGLVLDVAGGLASDGAVVQQWSSNGTDAQRWLVSQNSDGSYTIVSKLRAANGGALVLDLPSALADPGRALQLYSSNDTSAQHWHLDSTTTVSEGTYTLHSALDSTKVLDISSASLENGGNVQVWTSNGTLAQRFQLSYDGATGYYYLTSVASGKVLDVAGGSGVDGTNVWQYSSNGTWAQCWSISVDASGLITLHSAVGGSALDVSNASTANGANVWEWSSNGSAAQKWTAEQVSVISDGIYRIASASDASNVLDISGASKVSGGNAQLWTSNGTWAQDFSIVQSGTSGYYTIKNLASGMVLGVEGSEATSGSNVQQETANGGADQLWRPVVTAGGIVFVSKSNTGVVLDITNGVVSAGTNVRAWASNGSSAQKFLVFSVTPVFSEGYYVLQSAADTSLVLDVPSASTANGTPLQLWTANGTMAQRYWFEANDDGTFTIRCLCSSKVLDVQNATVNSSTGAGGLQQYSSNGTAAQRWNVSVSADGFIVITSALRSAASITASSTSPTNGTSVALLDYAGSSSQKFFPAQTGSAGYADMGMTLSEMADYQYEGTISGSSVTHTHDLNVSNLDPNNAKTLTVFADLRASSGLTAAQLDEFLSETSLGKQGTLYQHGAGVKAAADAYGINEAYLLAHAILESGWGTSSLASGHYYDGTTIFDANGKAIATFPGYTPGTYYNYFGYGAIDSNPLVGGLEYAISHGWNSPEAAIMGGAESISSHWMYRSNGYPQYTLYEMRWDTSYTAGTGESSSHQYASDYGWDDTIAQLMDECYSSAGVTPNLSYVIPLYRS